MSTRWVFAAAAIAATLIAGCSSGKTPTASTPARCGDVAEANVDLLAASDKDAARKAADTLERSNPPTSVKNAIEDFVSTGGAHFDDPNYTKNHKILDDWVKKVCPT